jgi:[ribosomal protein S5]-alanine N-acetyltransferase
MNAPLPATPTLETRRLTLRPIELRDAPAVQRRFPQWEIVRHLNAHVPWPYPDDQALNFLRMTLEEMARGEIFKWAITLREDPAELIGSIDLWLREGERDNRGFWLDPEFWGQGLMTEAAERVTEYAFLELGWPQLWLTNSQANVASHRIKEKQGATLIDLTPNDYVSGPGVRETWLLTREAWLARRGG